MKKVVSIALVFIMCLSLLSAGVLAAESSEDETAEIAVEAEDTAEAEETAAEAEKTVAEEEEVVSEPEDIGEDVVWAEMNASAYLYQSGGLLSAESSVSTSGGSISVASEIATVADSDASGAKAAILAGISNWSEEIDLSAYNISVSEVMDLYAGVVNENPELFYATGTASYSYATVNDVPTYVLTLKPTYNSNYTKSDVAVFEAAISAAMAEALPNTSGMSEYQIALALHDYLAQHVCYYDINGTESKYDAYNALVEGTGRCQAYCLAYAAMLKRLGMEVGYATSSAMGHMWNVVKIDGSWYHVDITSDDPVVDRTGNVNHDFFLNSDSQIQVTPSGTSIQHYGWVTSNGVSCTSTKYDSAYWQSKKLSAIYYIDGAEYYLDISNSDRTNTVSLIKRNGNTETTLYSFEGKWYVWGSDATYMIDLYSTLSYYNGVLYFNDPLHVYSVSPANTSKVNTVYTYTEGNGYICGSLVCSDGLTVELRRTYDAVYSIFKVTDLNEGNTSGSYDLGDVNGDGSVDIKDARTLFQYVNRQLSDSDVIADAMDVDGDGSVNAKDVRTLFQYANKQIDSLGK